MSLAISQSSNDQRIDIPSVPPGRLRRILLVVRHPVGGIRTYLQYVYGSLGSSHYQLTLITVRGQESEQLIKDLGPFGLKSIVVSGDRLTVQLWKAIRFELRQGKYDLIHSQGFTAGVIAILANMPRRVPHIITSHDVFLPEHFASWMSGLKKKVLSTLLAKADYLQSVSFGAENNMLEYLPRLRRQSSKLRVILNGIPVDKFNGNNRALSTFRQSIGIGDQTCLFGFMGRFMPQKGFDYVIDAVRILRDSGCDGNAFKIVAVNDGSYIREYKARIQKMRLDSYFIFYGFSPDVNEIYNGLDAVLMPSLWEACPLVPMEALVSGCPLISTESYGLKDVVVGTPTLLIKSRNASSIATAMKKVMGSPQVYKKLFGQYAPKARIRFDVRKTSAQLDLLIREALTVRV